MILSKFCVLQLIILKYLFRDARLVRRQIEFMLSLGHLKSSRCSGSRSLLSHYPCCFLDAKVIAHLATAGSCSQIVIHFGCLITTSSTF